MIIRKIFRFAVVSSCCLLLSFSDGKVDKYYIALKKNDGTPLEQYKAFLPPLGKFYADPMLFKYKEGSFLFFEDYDYKKGGISCVKMQESPLKAVKALDLPVHLSFPYVFQEKEDIYMTPETYDLKAVYLFKALDFPVRWESARVLIEGRRFSDPVLFKHEDRYYLFTSVETDILMIYHAKDLEGKFLPHPINMRRVKGRNAGPPFFREGKRDRPVKDCSRGYGKFIVFKEIVELTPEKFTEKEIGRILPTLEDGLDGIHGYSENEDYIVYDARRRIFPEEDPFYSSD